MKLFVWDFHGVLEAGNEHAVLKLSNMALEEFGHKHRFTPQQIHDYYGLKWFEYFNKLLPELDIEECVQLQQCCIQIQEKNPHIVAQCIYPTEHAVSVLESIINAGHAHLLISNTKPGALEMFIKTVGYTRYFTEQNTIAADGHHADLKTTKRQLFNAYIQDKDYDSYISVGDSPDDLYAIADVSGKTYLYSHPGREYKAASADYKIRDLREVLKEIK